MLIPNIVHVIPLVSKRLAALSLALGALLTAAAAGIHMLPPETAALVPSWCHGLVAILGATAMYLGGKGWHQPRWAEGRPLIPKTLVPTFLALAGLVGTGAAQLPATWQPLALLAASALTWMAGRVEPASETVVVGNPSQAAQPAATP